MKNFTIEIPYKLEVIEDIRSLGFKAKNNNLRANVGRLNEKVVNIYIKSDIISEGNELNVGIIMDRK